MKKGTVIRIIICVICIVGIIVCLMHIIPALRDYRASQETYDTLEEEFVSVDMDEDAEPEEEAEEKAVPEEEPVAEEAPPAEEPVVDDAWWYRDVSINFDALQKQNPEIVAWIRFDHKKQIGIDYPVLYSGDNAKYLYRDIYGKSRKAGALFFEGAIQDPISEGHKKDIIYGHLMKDGSMFAALKKYVKDASVYRDNPYFTVYKKGVAYRYRIFSYFVTQNGSPAYEYGFTSPDEAYRAHLDYLMSHSKVHDIEPDIQRNVLTLSTCAKSHSNDRIVVNGELIDVKATG